MTASAEVPFQKLSLKDWSDGSYEDGQGGEDPSDEDEDDYEMDEEEERLDQWGRVEDADWELARGDFTKMFNRSRQLAQVLNHDSNAASSSSVQTSSIPLPAMNTLRTQKGSGTAIRTGKTKVSEDDDTVDRIMTLSRDDAAEKKEKPSNDANRLTSRLRMQTMYDPSATAGGPVSGHVPRKGNAGGGEKKLRDKSDRSTIQQVLDPRTLAILFKMLQKGLLKQVNGVISTGKEANVYHASTYKYKISSETISSSNAAELEDQEEGLPLALKIYKTTILVFKDRDRYITGEFRFRHGYSRHNPRKMVKLWAEKEARNLKRLVGCGIRCPRPIELRDHVLVMEYLEDELGSGRNSPRLKDAEALIDARHDAGEVTLWLDLYVEMLVAMRTMFHQCKLVHADLSEYNVLYHREHLYIIDVSQSVEQDHPYAFDFLRADITHVDEYFSKKGSIKTLGLRETFEWIIRPPSRTMEDSNGMIETSEIGNTAAHESSPSSNGQQINSLQVLASGPFSKVERISRPPGESDEELTEEMLSIIQKHQEEEATQREDEIQAEDQAVFRQAYIPQTLNEILDPERDIDKRNEGRGDDLIYANVIGIDKKDGTDGQEVKRAEEVDGPSSTESDADRESEEEEIEDGDMKQKTPRGHRHEDRDAKRERKKEVKEAARERRKNKMPKAEKKKRMRNAHK